MEYNNFNLEVGQLIAHFYMDNQGTVLTAAMGAPSLLTTGCFLFHLLVLTRVNYFVKSGDSSNKFLNLSCLKRSRFALSQGKPTSI